MTLEEKFLAIIDILNSIRDEADSLSEQDYMTINTIVVLLTTSGQLTEMVRLFYVDKSNDIYDKSDWLKAASAYIYEKTGVPDVLKFETRDQRLLTQSVLDSAKEAYNLMQAGIEGEDNEVSRLLTLQGKDLN